MGTYEIRITCQHCGKKTLRTTIREEKPKAGEKIKCPNCHKNAIIDAVISNGQVIDSLDSIKS